MEEVALKDLDTRLQKQIENARKAVDKNPSYAVDILTNIVARNPACLDARKILRQGGVRELSTTIGLLVDWQRGEQNAEKILFFGTRKTFWQ